jgi:2-keto-4-pentenoate hydratase
MTTFDANQAIDSFWRHYQQGIYYPREWYDILTLDQAYQVQLGLVQRHVARGVRQAGWKVGLTSEATRQQFGVHEPVFGYVLEDAVHFTGIRIPHRKLIEPGVENEICMVMETDLIGPGVSEAHALRSVSSVSPALEIIETRGPLTAQLAVALADNAQQKAVVLGIQTRLRPIRIELPTVTVAMSINGLLVAEAAGEAVMGNPIRSVAWLANKLAEYGWRLEAGQLVMTGSLTRQFPMNPGDVVSATFDPLGTVTASFV